MATTKQAIESAEEALFAICLAMASSATDWNIEAVENEANDGIEFRINVRDPKLAGLFIGPQGRRSTMLRDIVAEIVHLHAGSRRIVRVKITGETRAK